MQSLKKPRGRPKKNPEDLFDHKKYNNEHRKEINKQYNINSLRRYYNIDSQKDQKYMIYAKNLKNI